MPVTANGFDDEGTVPVYDSAEYITVDDETRSVGLFLCGDDGEIDLWLTPRGSGELLGALVQQLLPLPAQAGLLAELSDAWGSPIDTSSNGRRHVG